MALSLITLPHTIKKRIRRTDIDILPGSRYHRGTAATKTIIVDTLHSGMWCQLQKWQLTNRFQGSIQSARVWVYTLGLLNFANIFSRWILYLYPLRSTPPPPNNECELAITPTASACTRLPRIASPHINQIQLNCQLNYSVNYLTALWLDGSLPKGQLLFLCVMLYN